MIDRKIYIKDDVNNVDEVEIDLNNVSAITSGNSSDYGMVLEIINKGEYVYRIIQNEKHCYNLKPTILRDYDITEVKVLYKKLTSILTDIKYRDEKIVITIKNRTEV